VTAQPIACPVCGEQFQKARGTQQSINGYRIVQACWACGYTSA